MGIVKTRESDFCTSSLRQSYGLVRVKFNKGFWTIFYQDPDTGAPLTVTKERYTKMLMEIFPEDSEEVSSNSIFMQDGAPAHTSRMSMEWLENRFPGRLLSNKSDFIWPPLSPDLNPLDFILWGYMKKEIQQARPERSLR